MSTYGDMQTNIASFLRRDDLTSDIQVAIKRAIRHYSNEPWPWLEERNTTSLTTVANTKTVALPSDFQSEVSLSITVSDRNYQLTKKTIQYIEDLYYSDSLTQEPFHYAIWDDSFYFYPIPDDAYDLTLDYYQELTELSNSSDTNAWTNEAEEIIEARAMWWLANAVMRNPAVAQSSKTREMEAYNRLRARVTLQSSSGKLRSSAHRGTWY